MHFFSTKGYIFLIRTFIENLLFARDCCSAVDTAKVGVGEMTQFLFLWGYCFQGGNRLIIK